MFTSTIFFSYLPVWLEQGPDSAKALDKPAMNLSDSSDKPEEKIRGIGWVCTLVSNETLSNVLKNILMLIHNNMAVEDASWMKRIAGILFTLFII